MSRARARRDREWNAESTRIARSLLGIPRRRALRIAMSTGQARQANDAT
jgi:hypothetical protein